MTYLSQLEPFPEVIHNVLQNHRLELEVRQITPDPEDERLTEPEHVGMHV